MCVSSRSPDNGSSGWTLKVVPSEPYFPLVWPWQSMIDIYQWASTQRCIPPNLFSMLFSPLHCSGCKYPVMIKNTATHPLFRETINICIANRQVRVECLFSIYITKNYIMSVNCAGTRNTVPIEVNYASRQLISFSLKSFFYSAGTMMNANFTWLFILVRRSRELKTSYQHTSLNFTVKEQPVVLQFCSRLIWIQGRECCDELVYLWYITSGQVVSREHKFFMPSFWKA